MASVAPFTRIFGVPVRSVIQLDGIVYQLGSLSLTWDLSHTTVRGVRGRTVIRTSAIGLLYFQSCSYCTFEDIVFEVTGTQRQEDYRGVVNMLHGSFRNIAFHRCIWRAPRAAINGVKIIVEAKTPAHAEGLAEHIYFYDCEIDGVGRMGVEAQNHSTDTTERYSDIVWEGGTIRNTGLVNHNGQGISFSGEGTACRVNALFDNNLLACIEGVGVRSSSFTGRCQNQKRVCNPLSFTNTTPMWDNRIQDFRTLDRANGEVQLWTTTRLELRDNMLDLTGGIHIRDVEGLTSTNETYTTRSPIGLFIEGKSRNNRWVGLSLDCRGTPKGAYSTVRFYGSGVRDNVIENARLLRASDGVAEDNLLGARNNRISRRPS